MGKGAERGKRTSRWLRWIARGVGTLTALFWLSVVVLGEVSGPAVWDRESAVMFGLILASAVAVLVAWRREGLGGVLVLACGLAHTAFALAVASQRKLLAVAVAGGPLLLAGVLFLASWWLSRRGGSSTDVSPAGK